MRSILPRVAQKSPADENLEIVSVSVFYPISPYHPKAQHVPRLGLAAIPSDWLARCWPLVVVNICEGSKQVELAMAPFNCLYNILFLAFSHLLLPRMSWAPGAKQFVPFVARWEPAPGFPRYCYVQSRPLSHFLRH